MTTDTPRTDAVAAIWTNAGRRQPRLWNNHARTLERELSAIREERARLREALQACEFAINLGLTLPNGELKPYATAWAELLAGVRAALNEVTP